MKAFEHCGGSYITPTDWVQQCVDLSAQAGTIVDVEFHMMASTVVNYAGWSIDDLEVFHGSDCVGVDAIFVDGFESGDTSAWSAATP